MNPAALWTMQSWTLFYVCIYMYTHIYTHMYICLYVYIHTHVFQQKCICIIIQNAEITARWNHQKINVPRKYLPAQEIEQCQHPRSLSRIFPNHYAFPVSQSPLLFWYLAPWIVNACFYTLYAWAPAICHEYGFFLSALRRWFRLL